MKRAIGLISMLAGSALAAGCATTAQPGASAAAEEKIQVTGSRVAQAVDGDARFPRTASPVYVITREDLERTGRVETGEALRLWPFLRFR